MHPLIIGGVGLAAILGILWASSGTAGAKQTNTKKNVAAGGAAYAAGKAAGYTQGGIDAATTGVEDLTPETNADMIAQSKTTDDPAGFLKGVHEGYSAGFAAAVAAKKLGVTYGVSMEEDPPPPPPEPPAAPAGKPKTYVADPNSAGYSTAYGSGRSYGRANSFENAPGSGNANALKTSDSYGARKKFDEAQMTLWSSSWDKGYQDGWDAGQVAYHEGVGGGTTESGAEPMLKVGGLLSVGHDSKTGNVLDVGGLMSVGHDSKTIDVGGLLSVGYDPRTGDVLKVGNILSVGYDPKTGTVLKVGSLLSVGHEPSTGTVLKVAGMRVLGIRRAYHAPIVTSTRRRPPGAIAVPIQEDWHVPHN